MGLIPAAMLGGVPVPPFDILNSASYNIPDASTLSRTPASATNRKTWSFSTWMKRVDGSAHTLIDAQDGANFFSFRMGATLNYDVSDPARIVRSTVTVFLDKSEWYHVLIVVDTTNVTDTDRIKAYINGVNHPFSDLIVGSGYIVQNTDAAVNDNIEHHVGARATSLNLEGYMAESHFVDGQALTPSDFAEEDSITGHWIPIEYAGTYGTNGFYLDYTNGTDLGEDQSGNNNDFTNVGVTQSTDTPTDNNGVLNFMNPTVTSDISNAGTTYASTAATWSTAKLTHHIPNGKWYWEMTMGVHSTGNFSIGIVEINRNMNGAEYVGIHDDTYGYLSTGDKYDDATATAYGDSYTVGDVIGVSFDTSTGDLVFYKNNVSQGTAYTGLTRMYVPGFSVVGSTTELTIVIPEDDWTYSAPSGFKAISTANFPTPDIVVPSDYFKTINYDDGAGAKVVGFQPDLAWLKGIDAVVDFKLVDSERGVQKAVSCNSTAVEVTDSTGLTSFDANGFTVGSDSDYANQTGIGMMAWCWKKGAIPGFDIVVFSGTLSAHAENHSLSVVPEMVLVTSLDSIQDWAVYHHGIASDAETDYLVLNEVDVVVDNVNRWNDTKPTSTQFTVGVSATVNDSGTNNMLAFLFATIEGFSRFGYYIGNAIADDGPFVYCGFNPALIMVKDTNSTNRWTMYDNVRTPYNKGDNNDAIFADTNIAQVVDGADITYGIHFMANGFKVLATHALLGASGNRYVFAAFAESPFQYSRAK